MWLVVQHVESDLSTTLAEVFQSAGIEPTVCRPFLGDDLPPADSLTGLVALGAPGGAADDDTPHLVRERDLLLHAVLRETPVLGICFGAQLLTVALGGSVQRAAHPSTGPGEVYMADGTTMPVMNWHRDEFVPPPGSTVLARDGHGDPRAFWFGRNAYGFQFHAEVDATLAGQVELDAGASFPDSIVNTTIDAGRALLTRLIQEST
ncbi:GMP synthase [Rhodococcoides trifolii]|uniref:GMP synthase n=1 Tax=Rhodococcoides trifolii TaxID=908250 RepID=A0A917FR50_9NOCA|nr:type 1 glutamine amidotransferase [Rhodococcus trifolii]GGF98763.1 GMP synthase [Rhodococcus trifolii]